MTAGLMPTATSKVAGFASLAMTLTPIVMTKPPASCHSRTLRVRGSIFIYRENADLTTYLGATVGRRVSPVGPHFPCLH